MRVRFSATATRSTTRRSGAHSLTVAFKEDPQFKRGTREAAGNTNRPSVDGCSCLPALLQRIRSKLRPTLRKAWFLISLTFSQTGDRPGCRHLSRGTAERHEDVPVTHRTVHFGDLQGPLCGFPSAHFGSEVAVAARPDSIREFRSIAWKRSSWRRGSRRGSISRKYQDS